jgi:hypothetical protein
LKAHQDSDATRPRPSRGYGRFAPDPISEIEKIKIGKKSFFSLSFFLFVPPLEDRATHSRAMMWCKAMHKL